MQGKKTRFGTAEKGPMIGGEKNRVCHTSEPQPFFPFNDIQNPQYILLVNPKKIQHTHLNPDQWWLAEIYHLKYSTYQKPSLCTSTYWTRGLIKMTKGKHLHSPEFLIVQVIGCRGYKLSTLLQTRPSEYRDTICLKERCYTFTLGTLI